MASPRIDALDNVAVKLSLIDAPHTTVQNRAQMADIASDLGAATAIDRIYMHKLYRLVNERGPSGQTVQGVENDRFGQVRYVGSWNNTQSTYGIRPQTSAINDYIEITFYGTGLNLLSADPFTSRDVRAAVDGGSEGVNILTSASYSDVLGGRNYAANTIVPVVAGLSLGIHTVRLRVNAAQATSFSGFEVINEADEIRVKPGSLINGKNPTVHSSATAADFDLEESTDAGAGGTVLLYEQNNSIKKAIRWADDNQLDIGSADHSNEEVIGVYHFREFGFGRDDDFVTLQSSTSDRAYTLDDNTTVLVGNDVGTFPESGSASESVASNTTGGFITITFVGTGLDLLGTRVNAAGTSDPHDIIVDGATTGSGVTITNEDARDYKIVSGLKYGTHIVRILRTASAVRAILIAGFKVYGPKQPTLPSDAVPLHIGYLMGDFVAKSTAGVTYIGEGVLRKSNAREMLFVNGTGGTFDWTAAIDVINRPTGQQSITDRQNAYMEYTFFGSGFEIQTQTDTNGSANILVQVDGQTANTTNFPGLTSAVTGTGTSFNTGTGIMDTNDAGSTAGTSVSISGLGLGLHTVRFTNQTASAHFRFDALDIITPIHFPKFNGPIIQQSTSRIGSQGMGDLREFSESQIPNVKMQAASRGTTSSPTLATINTNYPLKEMHTTIQKKKAGMVKMEAVISHQHSTTGNNYFHFYVNGVPIDFAVHIDFPAAARSTTTTHVGRVYLPVGEHRIECRWRTTPATATAESDLRMLKVTEE